MSKTYEQIEKIALDKYKSQIQRLDNIKQNSFFATLFLLNLSFASYYLSHINLQKIANIDRFLLQVDTALYIVLIILLL